MKVLFLLFCLTFSSSFSQEYNCPSSEDIKPCVCAKYVNELSHIKPLINCNGLSTNEKLLKAIKGMKNYKVSEFYLEKSNVGVLPSNIFSDMKIESLIISFTKVNGLSESLNRPPFSGLEGSLESLKITDTFTNDSAPLMSLSLSHLKKLKTLHLAGNILPVIGNDWFESGPYNLWELSLLDTYTTKVGSHAFVALEELRKFRLTGGHITEITREMLPQPAVHLESLDFRWVSLEYHFK